MNFSFVGIKWRRFLIIKLTFSFKTLHEQKRSFRAMTDPFLSQVFSSSVLILTVLIVRQLWVSGLIAVLMVEGVGCGLTKGRLVQIERLNNLRAGDKPFSTGWEFKNSIDK